MIPEGYVPDLQLRLALYRRLGDLETTEEIDGFGAELIDRFGPLPDEVQHLLKIVYHQGAVPHGQCGKARCRAEGRGRPFPQATSSPIRPALVALHRRAGVAGEDPAGPRRRLHARLADAGKAPRPARRW